MQKYLFLFLLCLSYSMSFGQFSYEGTYVFDDEEPALYEGETVIHPDYTVHYHFVVSGETDMTELTLRSFSLDDRLGVAKCKVSWDIHTDVMQIFYESSTNEEGANNDAAWAKTGVKKGDILFELMGVSDEGMTTTWAGMKPTKNLAHLPLEQGTFFRKEK